MDVFESALLILMIVETVWILYRIRVHKRNDYFHGFDSKC